MGKINWYGAVLFLVCLIGAGLIVGDKIPNWQIITMLSGSIVMTVVALTFDRFDCEGEEECGYFCQLKLYFGHLANSVNLDDFRPRDRVAYVKIPIIFFLPLGLLMFLGGCAIEACGWAPNGWTLNDYAYWISLNGAAIVICLIYGLLTSALRRKNASKGSVLTQLQRGRELQS